MYFLMQGTPFIYQGQEIGMTNVQFPNLEDYDDVAVKNLYRAKREEGLEHDAIMEIIWASSRDNSRTPMQWSAAETSRLLLGGAVDEGQSKLQGDQCIRHRKRIQNQSFHSIRK